MTQRDRDRLVVLKEAQKRLITQAMAASKLQVSGRQVRRRAKPAAPCGRGADAGTTEPEKHLDSCSMSGCSGRGKLPDR